jgi:hypothetical protein
MLVVFKNSCICFLFFCGRTNGALEKQSRSPDVRSLCLWAVARHSETHVCTFCGFSRSRWSKPRPDVNAVFPPRGVATELGVRRVNECKCDCVRRTRCRDVRRAEIRTRGGYELGVAPPPLFRLISRLCGHVLRRMFEHGKAIGDGLIWLARSALRRGIPTEATGLARVSYKRNVSRALVPVSFFFIYLFPYIHTRHVPHGVGFLLHVMSRSP